MKITKHWKTETKMHKIKSSIQNQINDEHSTKNNKQWNKYHFYLHVYFLLVLIST